MRTFFIICIFLIANLLHAQQPISNKGNRNQTYPNVTAVNPEIAGLTAQVSMDNLENSIRWMQDLGSRGACADGALQTQNWLMEQFESFGLDVYVHYFPSTINSGLCTLGDTLDAGNVVAIRWGTEFPEEFIVVSAHYDAAVRSDNVLVPGADDNASGTAGVVEIARILSQIPTKRSIIYLPVNAEEYGLIGSFAFVKKCAAEDRSILGCFNMDMIGFFPEDAGPLTMYFGSPEISDRLGEYYRTVANLYVTDIPTLRFSFGNISGSDHTSFNAYEYPALCIGDEEYLSKHPCYHQPCDTLGAGVNSLPLAQGFVKATLAAVAELANGWLPPQNLSAVPADSKITVSWDAAPETSTYKLFKNNVLLTEITETSYIDANVVNGTEYMYYVKGIRTGSGEESAESNRDSIAASPPLTLPYFNDFEENTDEWRANSGWERTTSQHYSGNNSFTSGEISPYHFSIAELCWFSIPDTATNISMSFYLKPTIVGDLPYRCIFIEASSDRKRWDKLMKIPEYFNSNWFFCQIPLNQYIGEPFVQIRIRVESLGIGSNLVSKLYFDDIGINFTSIVSPIPENLRITSYSENPKKVKLVWDAVPAIGYNIYRNNMKINDYPIKTSSYEDTYFTSPDDCYQVTAVYYPDIESGFSNEACIKDVGIRENIPFSNVKIIPNPSTGKVNVATGLSSTYHLAIYSMQGIKVFEKESFTDGILDISALPKGMYILKIATKDESIAKKIIIQ
jgi:hypothetical protein